MRQIANRVKNSILDEPEIYCLLIVFGVWYLTSLQGALSCDEVVYASAGHSIINWDIYVNLEQPPLAKYFIGMGQLIFGPTSFGARFPVAIFGLATVYMTYRVGRLLHSRFTGFVSALLLGGTYFFASYSVMSMLDVPLAFFTITLLWLTLKYVKADNLSAKYTFLIGFLSVCTMATKYYAVFFAIVPLGYLIMKGRKRYSLKCRLSLLLKYYVVGGLLAFILIYSPYIFISHPPVPERYYQHSMGWLLRIPATDWLLHIPIVGNFVYVFGYSLVFNLSHLGSGHLVMVGTTPYQYPPFWTYLYWLYERGSWIYILGIALPIGYVVHDVIKSKDDKVQQLIVVLFILLPLLFLSLSTVKFSRYIIPLFPIIAVCATCCLYRLLSTAGQKLAISKLHISPGKFPPALLMSIILLLILTPGSPLAASYNNPINTDSAYDQAARFIKDMQEATPTDEITVVSFYPHILNYYLDKENVSNVNVIELDYVAEQERLNLQKMISEGQIDVVIDYEYQPRFSNTELYHYIRNKAKEKMYFETSGKDNIRLAAYYGF